MIRLAHKPLDQWFVERVFVLIRRGTHRLDERLEALALLAVVVPAVCGEYRFLGRPLS
jgi:hypothetical protein